MFVWMNVMFDVGLSNRKGDVMNLLESAGFSRSNPYYIVKQGKVLFLPSHGAHCRGQGSISNTV